MAGGVDGPIGLVCVVALLLAGCTGKAAEQDAPAIASVDGHKLTTADLSDSVDPAGSAANLDRPARAAVDALIDEQLMAGQAVAAGMERDPAVAHALQNARRHILAQAFAARVELAQTQPTAAAIEDYYRRNPALFSERRFYSLAVFRIDSAALSDQLLVAIGRTTSAKALSQLLAQHSIRFELERLQRTADELPASQLSQYSAASVGDVLIAADANGGTRLIQIAAIEPRPSSLENARAAIQRYLTQLDRSAAVEAFLARARSQAQITYYVQTPPPSRTKQVAPAPTAHTTIAQRPPDGDAHLAVFN